MPSRKEMEAAIRKEGWKYRKVRSYGSEYSYWVDPVTDIHYVRAGSAYPIAQKRKAARETRRLRKAGWEYALLDTGWDGLVGAWCKDDKVASRAEAIQTLAEGPTKSEQNPHSLPSGIP